MDSLPTSPAILSALQNLDIEPLIDKDVTTILPFLSKLLLSTSFVNRQQLLRILYPIKKMNYMIELMTSRSFDTFDSLASSPASSTFESCSPVDKLRIVASEYIKLQEQSRQPTANTNPKLSNFDLFDMPMYVDDISYCLCILLLNPTAIPVINISDMSEALLHVKYGPVYITRLVANMPDRCLEVCQSLISYGERFDEGANFNDVSDQRSKTLRLLCLMNPSIAFTVQSLAIQMCKVPSLTIMITLDQLEEHLNRYKSLTEEVTPDGPRQIEPKDLDEVAKVYSQLEDVYDSALAFVTGLLLGTDEVTRLWFSQYTKSAQQKRIDQSHFTILIKFRTMILEYVNRLFPLLLDDESLNENSNEESSNSSSKSSSEPKELNKQLIRATATLRLFCALRAIGSIKLNPAECELLLRLITCKPPATQTSVNFATTGVCTLLSCSALVNNQKDERRTADWLKWIIKDSNYSDTRYSNQGKYSISELLVLISEHFQNNQNNQIAELVCSSVGMKLQIKASVSKCKQLFVVEVFSDQTIAEHAAKVSVTKNLNNKTTDLKKSSTDTDFGEFYSAGELNNLITRMNDRTNSKPSLTIKENLIKQLADNVDRINDDPTSLMKTINQISALPKEEIWSFVTKFMSSLSKIIYNDASENIEYKKLVQATTKLWWRFNTISPRELWVMTVNALKQAQIMKNSLDVRPVEHTWDELVLDPLIVLRCDTRVFRSGETLNIILHILSAFLAASRRSLQDQIIEQPNRQKDIRSLEELKTTLILAQTSAAIQILLEYCRPSNIEQLALDKRETKAQLSDNDKLMIERFESSVNCICEHLHQVFIADPNLAKLVHFQTYSSKLLPTTCDKIPSMHICLDFIPELLSQPDLTKQVFVIELTSHLCEKYAITKSLNVAKLCFNVAYTLLQLLPSERRALFFIPALPALMRICKVFSILREDANMILNQINQITLAHIASTSSRLSLGSAQPFEGLDKMSWTETEKLMSTFNSQEALYLCIQKCLIDIFYC